MARIRMDRLFLAHPQLSTLVPNCMTLIFLVENLGFKSNDTVRFSRENRNFLQTVVVLLYYMRGYYNRYNYLYE